MKTQMLNRSTQILRHQLRSKVRQNNRTREPPPKSNAVKKKLVRKRSIIIKQSTPAMTKIQFTTLTPSNKSNMSVVRQNQINLPATNNGSSDLKMSQTQEANEPKKNQSKIRCRETCFSDQYEIRENENEASSMEKWTTKEFYKISKTIEDNEELLKEDHVVLVKKFIDEGKVGSVCEGELAVSLLELKFDLESAIWASSQCKSVDEAIIILRKDCELCLANYPLNEFVQMLKCSHQCCKNCARNYFSVQITERAITDCTCPYCKIPELHDPNMPEVETVEYFSNLDIILKNILSSEEHELFQRKLRDLALSQDPNFKWCVECSSGFVASSTHRVLECPDCESRTCASCRKPWEEQHKGITCEQFSEWKKLNDPETQTEGIKKHLEMYGLQCPNCKFQYSIVRGGCLHLTCTQCKHKFCYGCAKPFKNGAECNVSNTCSELGLHAHHPRNCLYSLRDKEPHELQNLLRIHDIPFETESLLIRCPIQLQTDTPAGLVDTTCKGAVAPNHAGLCRYHYVEYLSSLVRKSHLDPTPILDLKDCVQELKRHSIPLPERGPWDTDPIYREMCIKVVQNRIPLE